MSEYEWEQSRVPRRSKPEFLGMYHPRPHEVEQYAALEHPRESVAWLLRPRVSTGPTGVASNDEEARARVTRRPARAEGARA
jgi:hypothetical protein